MRGGKKTVCPRSVIEPGAVIEFATSHFFKYKEKLLWQRVTAFLFSNRKTAEA